MGLFADTAAAGRFMRELPPDLEWVFDFLRRPEDSHPFFAIVRRDDAYLWLIPDRGQWSLVYGNAAREQGAPASRALGSYKLSTTQLLKNAAQVLAEWAAYAAPQGDHLDAFLFASNALMINLELRNWEQVVGTLEALPATGATPEELTALAELLEVFGYEELEAPSFVRAAAAALKERANKALKPEREREKEARQAAALAAEEELRRAAEERRQASALQAKRDAEGAERALQAKRDAESAERRRIAALHLPEVERLGRQLQRKIEKEGFEVTLTSAWAGAPSFEFTVDGSPSFDVTIRGGQLDIWWATTEEDLTTALVNDNIEERLVPLPEHYTTRDVASAIIYFVGSLMIASEKAQRELPNTDPIISGYRCRQSLFGRAWNRKAGFEFAATLVGQLDREQEELDELRNERSKKS